jgi:thioredoxin reductase
METADGTTRGGVEPTDVLIVGGGVAGLTAAVFTARAGLETLVVRAGESILRRNAHLENYPGFPAGVNPRALLDATETQAERAGVTVREGTVTTVTHRDEGAPGDAPGEDGNGGADGARFLVTVDGDPVRAVSVVVASKNDTGFLDPLEDLGIVERGSKTYVDADPAGRTAVEGLYAAGRVAEKPHQTVVAAGHGAEVALALVEDSDVPYYHDWTVPEGYFTDRGRELPPGCEEIDEAERREREREAIEATRAFYADPHPDRPTPHPSQVE